jgi:SAM-dependent methyltransferase
MSYGDYILNTGVNIAEFELFLMGYFYRTKFSGKAPILDLGAGRCTFTKQDLSNIIAVDIEPTIVDHFSKKGINITQGSAYEIPFPDDYFEGVFSCWLFEHLDKPDQAMIEIKRVLLKGGYALILVPSDKSLMRGFYDDWTHIRPFTKQSLLDLAKFTGFSNYNADHLPWARGSRLILHFFGANITNSYWHFFDIYGRRLGLVNRYSLMLEAWK